MSTIKKKGLGRGLSALFGDDAPQTTDKNSETKPQCREKSKKKNNIEVIITE